MPQLTASTSASAAPLRVSERAAFAARFAADWLLGERRADRLLPERWNRFRAPLLRRVVENRSGNVYAVERRRDLSSAEFAERYFRPGIPVVLEGAAGTWPATRKWTPDYLATICGDDEIAVLDGQNWVVNSRTGMEAVSTTEHVLRVRELVGGVKQGNAWYGAFMELLDRRAQLRDDLDFEFIREFGQIRTKLAWQRNVLAKMYMGGAGTSTSLHCAGISNLFFQAYGHKKWVLIPPEFTAFMYPVATQGINWQSRVDFRNPDEPTCPLYRFVDRYETVLNPGDVLWNPPFVWHGVLNLSESIAVSLWWTNITRGFHNNWLLAALTLAGRPNPIALQLGLGKGTGEATSAYRVHLNR